ncbi:MAG: bifunctional phosphoribosyl-AMP cyclohydrolase/phosphoribosyl-ATP diphosphatase HisIE [Eubacteriales bacterium]|nr:bifunctional phosphoribosyl-AMP cyclohydrolase/phosphoribosyl-ATP diphosphatase HisIE [Eubacteriales bacterium]
MKIVGDVKTIRYDEKGLVPVVTQDAATGEVLMLAYMNQEALDATLESGYCTYFSRSRQTLWKKGETSGHTQRVVELWVDCDGDSLLAKVEQTGPACHTGSYSCFHNPLTRREKGAASFALLREEYELICHRRDNPVEGSYTNYLFDKGIDKMCKKVGEESAEVIIAAKNPDISELQYEVADLLFHTMVVMAQRGLTWDDVLGEIQTRRK